MDFYDNLQAVYHIVVTIYETAVAVHEGLVAAQEMKVANERGTEILHNIIEYYYDLQNECSVLLERIELMIGHVKEICVGVSDKTVTLDDALGEIMGDLKSMKDEMRRVSEKHDHIITKLQEIANEVGIRRNNMAPANLIMKEITRVTLQFVFLLRKDNTLLEKINKLAQEIEAGKGRIDEIHGGLQNIISFGNREMFPGLIQNLLEMCNRILDSIRQYRNRM